MALDDYKKLWQEMKEEALKDYLQFLSIPSISNNLDCIEKVRACAVWLHNWIKSKGIQVEQWETLGHPALFIDLPAKDPKAPTLLLYGHYDVQPVDPLNEWDHDPFQPQVKNGVVTARGAQDNKGQCFYTLHALSALKKKYTSPPLHIKMLIEGEEEIGSPSLPDLLQKKRKELQADYVAIVDTGMRKKTLPAVTLGARGLTAMEVTVEGTTTDLHSGTHGGLAYNPIWGLVEILSQLKDMKTGRVQVPGFYSDVVTLKEDEKKLFSLEFDNAEYRSQFGVDASGGEKEFSPAERVGLRPTLEINGIIGGYTNPGFKTVIPAKASAKISCRLVPNQSPEKIAKLVKEKIESLVPEGVKVTVNLYPGTGEAVRANPHSKAVKAFGIALKEIFQTEPELLLEGGSIPITAELAKASGGDPLFFGVGLADDQIHAPNERFDMERFEKGFYTIARAVEILAAKE